MKVNQLLSQLKADAAESLTFPVKSDAPELGLTGDPSIYRAKEKPVKSVERDGPEVARRFVPAPRKVAYRVNHAQQLGSKSRNR